MPDDGVTTTAFKQHRGRNLPGKGALFLVTYVLRAKRDIGAVEHAADLHQVNRRRADGKLGATGVSSLDTFNQFDDRRRILCT
jgi:hypothetical protein